MDSKDDMRKEAPPRADDEPHPPRDAPAVRRETDSGAKDGPTRFHDWASI